VFDGQDADPDYQLLWPAEVFAEELAEILGLYGPHGGKVQRVLEEAFWGEAPTLDLSRPVVWAPAKDPWSQDPSSGARRQLELLIERADTLPVHRSPKPYWGAIRPADQSANDLAATARRDWAALIGELVSNGYLAKVAPPECVDGDAVDSLDEVLERELLSGSSQSGV